MSSEFDRNVGRKSSSTVKTKFTQPSKPLWLDPVKIKLRTIPGIRKTLPGGMIVINFDHYVNMKYAHHFSFWGEWADKRCMVSTCDTNAKINIIMTPTGKLIDTDGGLWYQAEYHAAGLFSGCLCDNGLGYYKRFSAKRKASAGEELDEDARNNALRGVRDIMGQLRGNLTGDVPMDDVPF